MGHKVNPALLRLQINKNWKSRWIAKRNFAQFLASDIEIQKSLEKRFSKTTGVAKVEISRDQNATKVTIFTSKPGMVIGRSGQGINELKAYLLKSCPTLRDPKTGQAAQKIDLEIMEIKNPDSNAELIAQQVAYQIERRIAYKRAIKQAIAKAMDAKVKGIKINVAGRLNGAEIARREHYGAGSVPLGRFRADIDYAHEDALTTYGIIGVKVWIYKGERIAEE